MFCVKLFFSRRPRCRPLVHHEKGRMDLKTSKNNQGEDLSDFIRFLVCSARSQDVSHVSDQSILHWNGGMKPWNEDGAFQEIWNPFFDDLQQT